MKLKINLLPLVILSAMAVIPAMTHEAPTFPEGDRWAEIVESQPKNEPVWTEAISNDFPNCKNVTARGTDIHDTVVVVRLDGSVESMSFDEAWDRGHDDNKANDVWTIGVCN